MLWCDASYNNYMCTYIFIFYLNACVSYLYMSSAYMLDMFDYIYIYTCLRAAKIEICSLFEKKYGFPLS